MTVATPTRDLPAILSKQLNLDKGYVINLVRFYDEKATIPFVARYRKDQTGNLDEIMISSAYDAIRYYNELFERKAYILEEIDKKGKLTPELREKIEATLDAKKLEDLYLPYREARKTKAEKAKDAGIEPLALLMLSPVNAGDPVEKAKELLNPEKGFDTVEKVIEGAHYIISQKVMESTDILETFLRSAFRNGKLISKKKKGYQGDELRFEDYYDYSEELSRLKLPRNTHRFLAIQRGENLKVLSIKTEVADEENIPLLKKAFLKQNYYYPDHVNRGIEIAYTQYLRPALDTRIIADLTETAEKEAIEVFTRNLKSALLAPPLPYRNVMGLDPGLRTGVKTVILDKDGTFTGNLVLYLNSVKDQEKSRKLLTEIIKKYSIGAIAIGNGTGSRETLDFVNKTLREEKFSDIIVSVVNEAGASVYSASKIAREEFPDLDVTVRGAISIGRRLQNPLAELVKIDPKSIGVGQYQHDVNQKRLQEALIRVVELCVNQVGVDINTASYSILTYISGLTEKTARNIIDYRRENGFFTSRSQIKKVKGIGPRAFEQCAGFLMIRDGGTPLDNTRVHPESYGIVEKIAKDHKMTTAQVINNRILFKNLDFSGYLTDTYQVHNFRALIDDLLNPGQDPRKEFKNISYREGVETVDQVKKGMTFEGKVTNVTNFGAFIDIGVHQDGLCHISQMADRFVKDPNEIVSVGDIVRTEVISVDYAKKRISLKLMN